MRACVWDGQAKKISRAFAVRVLVLMACVLLVPVGGYGADAQVTTLAADAVTFDSAELHGNLTDLGGESEVDVFFRWREEAFDGLLFDGSNSRVELSVIGASDTDVSVTMWIKPDQWSGAVQLLFWGEKDVAAFEVSYRGDKSGTPIEWFYWDGSVKGIASSTLPPLNQWSHLAFVYVHAADMWHYYLNGSEVASGTVTLGSFTHTGEDGRLGWHPTVPGSRPYKGAMSDVRIYTNALSANEVQDLYAGEHVTVDLIAHWRLDDASGSTAADSSGNDYDGNVLNGSWISSAWMETTTHSLDAVGAFDETITGLDAFTDYHYHAVVQWDSGAGEARGENVKFTTLVPPLPDAPTNTWIGTGNASVATNWSLGVIPASGHDILLSAFSTGNMTWDGGVDTGDGVLTDTVASWTQTAGYNGVVTFQTTYPDYSATFTNFTVTGDATINGGAWQHPGPQNHADQRYRLRVSVGGDLQTGEGSAVAAIRADERGFGATYGPGAHPSGSSRTAGAHGGSGGSDNNWNAPWNTWRNNNAYGSFITPTTLGSGGSAHPGGGAIYITVDGETAIGANGIICANGRPTAAGSIYGSGAGGSVQLRTGTLSGGGTIRAHGGDGGGDDWQLGGGGRVAVILTGPNADFTNATNMVITAYGGRRPSGTAGNKGSSGSVYLLTGAEYASGLHYGAVYVRGLSTTTTFLPFPPGYIGSDPAFAFVDDFSRSRFFVEEFGRLRLIDDVTLPHLVLESGTLLDLNGFILNVRSMTIGGVDLVTGTHTAASLGVSEVEDTSSANTGQIVRPALGTYILIK